MGPTVFPVPPAVDETYPLRPTGGQVLSMLFGGFIVFGGLSSIEEEGMIGAILIGTAIVALAVAAWRARKVRLTEKALILSMLGRQRTIPYSKIETVDLGHGLGGMTVWISGTGTTKTAIPPHTRAQELHDKLCMFASR